MAFAEDRYQRAFDEKEAQAASVAGAEAALEEAQLMLEQVLPSQIKSAKAVLAEAQVALEKTKTYAIEAGRVEQLTLAIGARAAEVALKPSMVIIPDRGKDDPLQIAAGFNQIYDTVLHEGMPAEIACNNNLNSAMSNSVMPARIVRIQDVVATGQLTPTEKLLQPSDRQVAGDLVVHFQAVHPEHEALLVPGSKCMVQVYTTKLFGSLEGTMYAGVVQALALEKALLMRMRVWVNLAVGSGLGGD